MIKRFNLTINTYSETGVGIVATTEFSLQEGVNSEMLKGSLGLAAAKLHDRLSEFAKIQGLYEG